MIQRTNYIKRIIIVTIFFVAAMTVNMVGLSAMLPSQERLPFYPSSLSWYKTDNDEKPVYWTAPYESLHPDEGFIFGAIANMSPANLDFNPRFFNYPSLQIYITAVGLKLSEMSGFVVATSDLNFYINNPEEMGKIYWIGRLIVALQSAGAVVLLYLATLNLFQRQRLAILAGILLCFTPFYVRNSHFMTIDIPAVFWLSLSFFAAILALNNSDKKRFIYGSALAAGFAFSTKYPMLPTILLPVFALKNIEREQLFSPSFIRGVIKIVAVFSAGFLSGSPYILVEGGSLFNALSYEGGTKLGFPSITLIANQIVSLGGLVYVLLIGVGLILAFRKRQLWQMQIIFLLLFIGMSQRIVSDANLLRYMTSALPAFALLAGIGVEGILKFLQARGLATFRTYTIVSFLLFPQVGYTMNTLQILNGKDLRIEVAEWIDTHVAENSFISINGPLYFFMPPIHAEKYGVESVFDREPKQKPNLYVFSSVASEWVDAEIENPNPKYVSKEWSQRPWRGWTWPIEPNAHDLGYTFFDIWLFYDEANIVSE